MMGCGVAIDAKAEFEHQRDLSGHAGIVYTFMSERGRQDYSYAQYLADHELRGWVNDTGRYRLILGRTICTYSMGYLTSHKSTLTTLRDMEEEQRKNPLRFFAPSGNQALAYLNDYDNDLCILTACNRFGKTMTMIVKKIINSIPCDPSWEIFKKYGVKYRPFTGPQSVGLASYDFGFHRDTSVKMLLDWLPKKELGVYAKDYKGKGAKQVNLNNVPILPVQCGTDYHFAAMSQGQAPFEGNVKGQWGWDEQNHEAAFDGADERTRTVVGGRHDFALTPHVVEGRPDTGAGSWINKIYDGEVTKGRRIGTYEGQVWDVPDWIYPEEAKLQAFEKHVLEPMRLNDEKKRREGESRFFGKWHESSGLVLDEWNSDIHVIEPFDIPRHWTLFRGFDHGSKHPAACVCAAMNPGGDLFFYRDYLRTGRIPSQIAADIIEMCGNKRKKIGSYRNPKTDQVYDRYEEIQSKEAFQWTKMDARAFSQRNPSDEVLISKLYTMAGLKMTQGSGAASENYVPILKEWFAIDPKKKHFVTGELGASRVYVFSTCTDLIRTIKRWTWEERKTRSSERLAKESPSKKDDDLCDAMKMIILGKPRFVGNPRMSDEGNYETGGEFEEPKFRVVKPLDVLTGY